MRLPKINSSTLLVNGLTGIASLLYLGAQYFLSNQDTLSALVGQNHAVTTALVCNLVTIICRLYNNAGPRKPIEMRDPKKALETLTGKDDESSLPKPPISTDTTPKENFDCAPQPERTTSDQTDTDSQDSQDPVPPANTDKGIA